MKADGKPKIEVEDIYSSETSVDFQRTTRRYSPEDSALHNYRCEDLKSYTVKRRDYSEDQDIAE
jgi:hypothetical protein